MQASVHGEAQEGRRDTPEPRAPAPSGRTRAGRAAGFLRFAGEQRYDPDAPLSALTDHPDNPRHGDDPAVSGSIEVNGWYGVIIAQLSTGRILAGHTRRRALMAQGVTNAPVLWVDVDEPTARRILLADNRTAELAVWDQDQLAAVLSGVDPAELAGTGFTADDLLFIIAGNESASRGGDGDQGDEDGDGTGLWPLLTFRVPPLVLARFRAVEGADDAHRLAGLVGEPIAS